MNFNCKECNKKISAHNKDWHDDMCDDCFNNKHYPNEGPESDSFSEANSKGKCRFCNKEFFGKEIMTHLKMSEFSIQSMTGSKLCLLSTLDSKKCQKCFEHF